MSGMRSAAACGDSEIAEVHVVPHALSRVFGIDVSRGK
jgi:hypothetical protein